MPVGKRRGLSSENGREAPRPPPIKVKREAGSSGINPIYEMDTISQGRGHENDPMSCVGGGRVDFSNDGLERPSASWIAYVMNLVKYE